MARAAKDSRIMEMKDTISQLNTVNIPMRRSRLSGVA